MKQSLLFYAIVSMAIPLSAHAYPNGPDLYVTDMLPACASCHAVLSKATMPEMPDAFAESELSTSKHFGAVRSKLPPSPYLELTERKRPALFKRLNRSINMPRSLSAARPR